MIAYFDTSAFVPLLVREPGTPVAERVWDSASGVASSRLLIVEAAAALAMARRQGRIGDDLAADLAEIRDELLDEVTFLEAEARVVDRAALLADRHGLRGYDAMHLASAQMIEDGRVLFVSGDRKLIDAATREGLLTTDTSRR